MFDLSNNNSDPSSMRMFKSKGKLPLKAILKEMINKAWIPSSDEESGNDNYGVEDGITS